MVKNSLEKKFKKSYLEQIGKTLYWLFFNIFYGLMPLIILFISNFLYNKTFDLEDDVLKKGILIFLSIALSGSVTIDYVFIEKKIAKWIENILYTYIMIIILFAGIIYSQLNSLGDTNKNMDFDKLLSMQYIIIICTLGYTLFLKTVVFSQLDIMNNKTDK